MEENKEAIVEPADDEEMVVVLETTVGEALAMTEEEFVEWALEEREKKLAELADE